MGFVLLTGATGLLGRYLLRDLSLAEHSVAVIARGDEFASARNRVDSILSEWENILERRLPRPVVIEGDITLEGLGLGGAERKWVRNNCYATLHNAASLTFHGPDRHCEPWKSNLDGTRHVLELCREAGIRQFHHVSTAYVCGRRAGPNLESELDVGQSWRNEYEISKVEAEKLVRGAEFIDSATIYRPSIILGDSRTGYTSTFHAFYAPLRLAAMIVSKADAKDARTADEMPYLASMQLRGDETKNFVPVDWVSSVIAAVVLDPRLHGTIYHLTNPTTVTVGLIQEVVLEAVRPLWGTAATQSPGWHARADADVASTFREGLEAYRSYWSDDPRFDSRNVQAAFPDQRCPPVDRGMLLKFARYALEAGFGWPRKKPVLPVFDFAAHVEQLADAASSEAPAETPEWFGLQVKGPGGGQWRFGFVGDHLFGVEPGLGAADETRIELDSNALLEIAHGSLGVQEAMELGLVLLSGRQATSAVGAKLIDTLLSSPGTSVVNTPLVSESRSRVGAADR